MGEGHGYATRSQVGRFLEEMVRVRHRRHLAEPAQIEVVESDISDQHSDACDPVAAKHVLRAWQHNSLDWCATWERCKHEKL